MFLTTWCSARFVVLARADSDQITLLNLTAADKKLADLPKYKSLLQNFITQEVRHVLIVIKAPSWWIAVNRCIQVCFCLVLYVIDVSSKAVKDSWICLSIANGWIICHCFCSISSSSQLSAQAEAFVCLFLPRHPMKFSFCNFVSCRLPGGGK